MIFSSPNSILYILPRNLPNVILKILHFCYYYFFLTENIKENTGFFCLIIKKLFNIFVRQKKKKIKFKYIYKYKSD